MQAEWIKLFYGKGHAEWLSEIEMALIDYTRRLYGEIQDAVDINTLQGPVAMGPISLELRIIDK